MRRALATAIVCLLFAGASPSGAAELEALPQSCASTPPAAAARFVDAEASIEGLSAVGGLDVAIATDWRITPGFQTALLRVGAGWCSVELFNDAVDERLAGASALTVASAFARVAAMPYLGDVVVEDASATGSVVTLTTTGGRHGAVSDWTITVDHLGVRAARFTTTGWDLDAVRGSVDAHAHGFTGAGDLEGITSLPGHTRTFTRLTDGRVVIDATVDDLLERSVRERELAVDHAAEVAGLPPGDDLKHTFEDGLTIKVSYGMSPYTPDAGLDTGVKHADRLRTIHAGVVSHYKDFYRWGVRDPFDNTSRTFLGTQTGLPEAVGYINVDSPMSPVCLACAYLTEAIEVHIMLLFPELAQELVAISYPDSEKFMQSVIGHEMVHGLQGGYGNGQAGVFTSAFIEGAARASESLHDNAPNSFQRGAIHFNDNSNGCEGFENGRAGWIQAQAAGPFNGHTYDACYFWWTYYAGRGPEGLAELLKAMPEAAATSSGSAAARNIRLLEVASGSGSGALDLAFWGAAVAAGSSADGFTLPAGRTGQRLDWMSLMLPGTRAAALQPSQNVVVSAGGVRSYLVQEEAQITEVPAGAVSCMFDNVERQLIGHAAAAGTRVIPGQIVVVAAATDQTVQGPLTVEPGSFEPGPATAPCA